MPAEKLTLPRLLLEFRSVGVYRVDHVDAEHAAVRFKLAEALAGAPAETEKQILRLDGKFPPEFAAVREGDPAVLFGPDPYGRGLTFLNDHWCVSNFDGATGWWRIAYTSTHYDFGCAFAGTVPGLIDASRKLLDGEEAPVPCHAKPGRPEVGFALCTLRDPHRRALTGDPPTTRAAAAPATHPSTRPAILADRLRGSSVEQLAETVAKGKDPFARRQAAVLLGQQARPPGRPPRNCSPPPATATATWTTWPAGKPAAPCCESTPPARRGSR